MSLIKIHSNIRDYCVYFGDLYKYLQKIDKCCPDKCYIIDAKVWSLYRDNVLAVLDKKEIIILSINEERKCLDTVQQLYDQLIEQSAKRNITIISIGGGITQDISGFLASTLYRGVNWIFIPTTLLAQADSCIGSKTSLNYKSYKNLIGTFYPPSEIFIDTKFLITQKCVDFYSGLGEVVKLFIMGGEKKIKDFLNLIAKIILKDGKALSSAVYNSLLIKKGYIETDEFDSSKRILLNYGHCFGHALETASNFVLPHGQAIVIGMLLANLVAKSRGLLSVSLELEVRQDLLFPVLEAKLKRQFFNTDVIISGMKKDKKRTGEGLALVMLTDNYQVVKADDISVKEAEIALDELAGILKIKK